MRDESCCNARIITHIAYLCRAMASERRLKVVKLADLIYQHLVAPDPERVSRSGSLTPTVSLRHKTTRESLQFAKEIGSGRFFTQAMVRDAIQELVDQDGYKLDLPSTPGFEMQKWISSQAASLHSLLKRARKSTCTPAMDAANADTQPWDIYGDGVLDPNQD